MQGGFAGAWDEKQRPENWYDMGPLNRLTGLLGGFGSLVWHFCDKAGRLSQMNIHFSNFYGNLKTLMTES